MFSTLSIRVNKVGVLLCHGCSPTLALARRHSAQAVDAFFCGRSGYLEATSSFDTDAGVAEYFGNIARCLSSDMVTPAVYLE